MAGDEHVAFEHMLVHNLKTPLTGILASLEMLHDGDLGELNTAQRAAIGTMQAQGVVLVRMIDELLDVGRLGSPALRVQRVPVDPSGFLVELRSAWSGRLPRLTSVIAPDVPDVVADADLLRRVFDNLLMNALVHAGANATVTLRAERVGDTVRFSVSDDGPGIGARDAERVFEPFVTLEASGVRKTHGLGLAYCRAATAAMGGTIALVPGGRGATFAVEVPAAVVLTRQALEQDQ
jgi:signal transduction histidine kinase